MIEFSEFSCALDDGIASRAAIGLVVLATDQTIEYEFHHWLRLPGVAIYEARLFNDNEVSRATLRAMGPRIAPATALILPDMPLNVVAFGCTSATMELGEDAVFAEIRRARPGVACTTPVTAARAAFAALGARRIAVLTPYAPAVNANVHAYLTAQGLEIAAFGSFNKPDDREAARISEASIADGVAALVARARVDAVFVSCTSLRLAGMVSSIERRVGVPVTSSNHAMAWHSLRLAGVKDTIKDLGQLFEFA